MLVHVAFLFLGELDSLTLSFFTLMEPCEFQRQTHLFLETLASLEVFSCSLHTHFVIHLCSFTLPFPLSLLSLPLLQSLYQRKGKYCSKWYTPKGPALSV